MLRAYTYNVRVLASSPSLIEDKKLSTAQLHFTQEMFPLVQTSF